MRQERRSRNIKPAVHQLHRIRFPSQVFWSFLFFLNKILRCCGGWCKPQLDFMKVFHLTRSRNRTPCTPIMWWLQLPGGKLGDDTQHESSQQFCEYDNTITSSYSNDPRARVVFPFFLSPLAWTTSGCLKWPSRVPNDKRATIKTSAHRRC